MITLTYTQVKQLLANADGDMCAVRRSVEALNNQPRFITAMGAVDSVAQVTDIIHDGCASGAYMPAVMYATARDCMHEHSTEITEVLLQGYHDVGGVRPFDVCNESWEGYVVYLVSHAVELWALQFENMLESVEC